MNRITHTRQAQPQGWHPADVVAILRKRGWSLRRLSVHHGYGPTALSKVLQAPWPKGEALVAAAAGVLPQVIWPDRYGPDGRPNRRPGPKPGARVVRSIKNTKTPEEVKGKRAQESGK